MRRRGVGWRMLAEITALNIRSRTRQVNFFHEINAWDDLANNDATRTALLGIGSRPTAGTTLPGTKKRVALFDENGERIRGREKQEIAEHALARAKLSGEMQAIGPAADQEWIVARICSEYLQYCERSVAASSMSPGHRAAAVAFLNDLCGYCGALPVTKLTVAGVAKLQQALPGAKSNETIQPRRRRAAAAPAGKK